MQNYGKTALGLDANIASMLCYVPFCLINLIFILIVLVTERSNKFARFHAFQSILLIISYIVVFTIFFFLSFTVVVAIGSKFLSGILSLLSFVISLAYIGISVLLCIKAWKNEMFKLPIIGDLADKWS